MMNAEQMPVVSVPWFGARKLARALLLEVAALRSERDELRAQFERLGALSVIQLETRAKELEADIAARRGRIDREREAEKAALDVLKKQLADARKAIVETEDLALLQEAGIYHYQHPLTDAVAYERELEKIDDEVKAMTRKDGGAPGHHELVGEWLRH